MSSHDAKLQLLVEAISQLLTKVNTAINTRTAPDSLKLGGKSLAQLESELGQVTSGQIDALAADLAAFIARTDNPHNVTAAQVGLGSLTNAGFATQQEAEDGVAGNVYASPLSIAQFIAKWWADQLGTTPETLDTIQEIAEAITNNASAIEAIEAIAAGKETPAGAQAKVDAAVASLEAQLATKLDANAQAVDSAMLEGQTLAQVLAAAAAAVPEVDLSGKLDVTAQAADSAKLNGKTQAELTASVEETATGTATDKWTTPAGVKGLVDTAAAGVQSGVDALALQVAANGTAIADANTSIDTILTQLKTAFDDAAVQFEPEPEV